jgi:uncharacterized protein YuzE
MEVTFTPDSSSFYVALPGHEQAVTPFHTHRYCSFDAGAMIVFDHDQLGRVAGIEIHPGEEAPTLGHD